MNFVCQFARIATCGLDRRADDEANRTRPFAPAAPRPEYSGIVRDRNDWSARIDTEERATQAVTADLTRRYARPLREDDYPVTVFEPLASLGDNLIDR